MQIIESHGFMCEPSVAEGTIDGVCIFQDLAVSYVEGGGVNDFGRVQKDAVEGIGVVGDESGINGLGRGGGRFFWRNTILCRTLGKS